MEDNIIHPSVIFDGDVELGAGNKIGPNVVLIGPLNIGNNNFIGANCVIGAPPEDAKNISAKDLYANEFTSCGVDIGNGNVIRELTAVHGGVRRKTRISDLCWIHSQSHIDHDDLLLNEVILAPCVSLSGNVTIMENAQLGISSCVHQNLVIGASSMIAMNATVTKNVVPFSLVKGTPARASGANKIKLERQGIDREIIDKIDEFISSGASMPEFIDPEIDVVFGRYFELLQ